MKCCRFRSLASLFTFGLILVSSYPIPAQDATGSSTGLVFTVGYIQRQLYFNIGGGNSVSELTSNPKFPNSPDQVDYLGNMGWPTANIADSYGGRLTGYLVPPVTGTYTFAVSSDDASQVFLSPDDQPSRKVLIVEEPGCCNGYDAHVSSPVSLVAGKQYYIEALVKEGAGGDYLYVAWKTPLEPNNWAMIPGTSLGNYFSFSNSTISILRQPTNTTTIAGQTASFSVAASGQSVITTNLTYQWQRNEVDIEGANSSSYTTPAVFVVNSGDRYRVKISIPGKTVMGDSAVLTVLPDTFPPTLTRVQNIGATNLSVVFSEPVEATTALNRLNYTFTNGVTALAATWGLDTRTVILTTSPLVMGSTCTVFVSQVRDRADQPNVIAPNSPFTFTVTEYASQDIGAAAPPGSSATATNGYDLRGGGQDIGGTSDQFLFDYQKRTGDFDVRVRVQYLNPADPWAKAGLMAREDLGASARFAATLTTPSIGGSFFQYRTPAGNNSARVGSLPVNYPHTWLRLKRQSNQFTGYASYDGQTWAQLGTVSIAMPGTIYFGFAVSSHTTNQTALAQFRDISTATGAVLGTPALTAEPLGPSSRKSGLAISEIMYKPAPRSDTNNLEFVELFNSNPFFEDISGYRLSGDIGFTFPPGTVMPGGSFLVVAKQPSELREVYKLTDAPVLGPYEGALKVPGLVRLRTDQGAILLETEYDDRPPWPVAADGAGHSLVLARPSYGERDAKAWDSSDTVGGSPGGYNGARATSQSAVVINEFLAHTDPPLCDYIELYNHSKTAVDLSGCVLTDDPNTNRFVLPPGTTIPARGFLVVYETNLNFALSAAGERIYFKSADLTRVLDAVDFDAQANGISSGRWPDGAPDFYPLAALTPGTNNGAILIHDIVINELMYKPISGLDEDQYIELYNRGTNPVNLGGWRLSAAVDYTFPTNTVLATNGYLVVAKEPTRLLASYSNLTSAVVHGPFQGALAGKGERVVLTMPDVILSTNSSGAVKTNLIHIAVDEVTYGTGGQWPPWAHGGGSSLELIHPFSNHRLANNWADSDETAKAPWTTIQAYGPMDHGSGTANAVEGGLQEEGECLLDDVEVIAGTTGPNLVANPGFESGQGSWVMRGNHVRSGVEMGTGFGGGRSLHVRATSRCDYGPNRIYSPLTSVPSGNVTIRAKVRWLKGWPEMLLRLHGNYFEVAGRLTVPGNLGTPGARNSRAVNNAPPAVYEVAHSPVLPAGGQAVVVTARIHDAGGIASAALKYRIDPNTSYTTVTMVDTGAGGDAIAGDGLYSASIPAQSSGALAAFLVTATDSLGAARLYPTNSPANGRMRECLVRFGDPTTFSGFGTYRMWFTQGTVNDWINRPIMSNEPEEGTFVYGNFRAIHSFGCRYAGSPWHQGWSSPLSDTHYTASMPADNQLLGTTGFNKIHAPGNGPFDDDTLQREQAGNWIARQLRIPWTYRRFVNVYVNGNLRRPGALMEDMQIPDPDFIEEYWPDDHDGALHKTQGWYEMDDAATGAMPNTGLAAWCSLDRFTTTVDGATQYKLARYRWNWFARAIDRTANDYREVFRLVEAINTTPGPALTANMLALADVEEWMRAWAVRHLLGDWDFYGGPNGQNAYAYKPVNGKWNVFLFDMNIIMGNGSSGPGEGLFSIGDGNLSRLYNHPPFRRMYFRALKEICTGPIVEANLGPIVEAKYAAFRASGINPASPAGIKSWLAQARTSVLATVAAEDTSSFSVNGGNPLVTGANLITLSGRAPVEVKTIRINGVDWNPTWTSVVDWTLQLPVSAATNQLAICGYDIYGKPVAGANNALTVVYTQPVPSPVGNLLINEIMYAPAVSNAAYVEICNRSTNYTFDLSGWRLQGVDFTFPDGTLIAPGAFLVVVENRAQFVAAYGSSPRIAGEYAGRLNRDGETLRLIQPGAGSEPDLVVSEVRYGQNLPWPAEANGIGPSLQLMDAAQDIRRVCNWGVGNTNVAPQPEPEWVYVTTTGTASSSQLYIYLDSAGEVYLDDLKLVLGSVPEAGANMIQNGDFESALSGPWTVSANLSGSSISTKVRHSGNSSLRMVSSSAGTTQGSSIWQGNLGLPSGAAITLSFWYLPTTNGNHLTLRLSYSGLISTTSISSSSEPTQVSLYTPGAKNSIRASLPSFPPLWINEVMPGNVTNLADRLGRYAPWIELYNAGTNSVNLGGFYLTDTYTNLANWAFPSNASIPGGQFLVVFADGLAADSIPNELHTSFRLNPTTGSVALAQMVTNQPRVLDYLNYRLIGTNRSYGSLPDGQPIDRKLFSIPTPGGTNNGAFPPVQVFINEWMADNTVALADPADGRYQDWFELYNAGAAAVDLNGFTLTDNLSQPRQYTIPAGKTIPAGGFLLVWADQTTSQNSFGPDIHADFQLSKGGEAIGLYDPNGNQVDAVTFGAQLSDVSQGRWPDGYPNFIAMTNPTPRAANVSVRTNTAPALAPIADQTVEESALLSFTITAADADQPAQSLAFSLDTDAPDGAAIDPLSGVFTWTPTEAQGPGVYPVTVLVADNGTPPLSGSRAFTITVREVNAAPLLAPPGDWTVTALTLLTFTNTASDADLPPNTLAFSLADAPAGASIDPDTGVFSWTPAEAQAPGVYTMTVQVIDDSITPANAFRDFTVTVNPASVTNGPRLISITASNGVTLTWESAPGRTYQVQYKDDLAAGEWTQIGNDIEATGAATTFSEHPGPTVRQRFYRVKLVN